MRRPLLRQRTVRDDVERDNDHVKSCPLPQEVRSNWIQPKNADFSRGNCAVGKISPCRHDKKRCFRRSKKVHSHYHYLMSKLGRIPRKYRILTPWLNTWSTHREIKYHISDITRHRQASSSTPGPLDQKCPPFWAARPEASRRSGWQYNIKICGLNFSLKNGLRFQFESVTCLNYPFFNFFSCRES